MVKSIFVAVTSLSLVLGFSAGAIILGDEVLEGDPVLESTVGLISADGYAFDSQGHVVAPITESGSLNCGSVLISEDLLLTAAHCIAVFDGTKEVIPSELIAVLDRFLPRYYLDHSSSQFDGSSTYRVSQFKVHPEYTFVGKTHDLALVKLPNAIRDHKPVLLSAADQDIQSQMATAAGWGIKEPGGEFSSQLFKKQLKVVEVQKDILIIEQSQGGVCVGDSGGPLYLNKSGSMILIGIVHGPARGSKNCSQYAAFTRVSAFSDFILQGARELGATTPQIADSN
jgi:secreted trypsin-like serine protease